MENPLPEHIAGIAFSRKAYPVEISAKGDSPESAIQSHTSSSKSGPSTSKQSRVQSAHRMNKHGKIAENFPHGVREQGRLELVINKMNKLGRKVGNFAHGVREHVRFGPNITQTVKGKWSLGTKILRIGGVEKVFKHLFIASEGEKLWNASQCYLSTTAGPIAGLLFISSNKVSFCSEKSIKFSSRSGESHRHHYKILIPLEKIKTVNVSEDVKKPSTKYIELITLDNFDFWFMGFLNCQKAFKYLQMAIYSSHF